MMRNIKLTQVHYVTLNANSAEAETYIPLCIVSVPKRALRVSEPSAVICFGSSGPTKSSKRMTAFSPNT